MVAQRGRCGELANRINREPQCRQRRTMWLLRHRIPQPRPASGDVPPAHLVHPRYLTPILQVASGRRGTPRGRRRGYREKMLRRSLPRAVMCGSLTFPAAPSDRVALYDSLFRSLMSDKRLTYASCAGTGNNRFGPILPTIRPRSRRWRAACCTNWACCSVPLRILTTTNSAN